MVANRQVYEESVITKPLPSEDRPMTSPFLQTDPPDKKAVDSRHRAMKRAAVVLGMLGLLLLASSGLFSTTVFLIPGWVCLLGFVVFWVWSFPPNSRMGRLLRRAGGRGG